MSFRKEATGWNFADPKVGDSIFSSCRVKSPTEFVGRVFRMFPEIKLAQLTDISGRHFDLTPKEYSKVEEDFIRFADLKDILSKELANRNKTVDGFIADFFKYSSSGGLDLALSLASKAFNTSDLYLKDLKEKFSSLANQRMASHHKGFEKTASLPLYDWNVLDPVWEFVDQDGIKAIRRKI